MSLIEQIANQLVIQRNEALNALAEVSAKLTIATKELEHLRGELAKSSKDEVKE